MPIGSYTLFLSNVIDLIGGMAADGYIGINYANEYIRVFLLSHPSKSNDVPVATGQTTRWAKSGHIIVQGEFVLRSIQKYNAEFICSYHCEQGSMSRPSVIKLTPCDVRLTGNKMYNRENASEM